MKKVIHTMLILFACLSACKKETIVPNPSDPVVQSKQDTKLFGTWILDSLKTDGSVTMYPTDTLYITAAKYSDNLWVSGMSLGVSVPAWHTSNDSLIAVYRAKYAINGSNLWQYVNNKPNANDQRWYHKK